MKLFSLILVLGFSLSLCNLTNKLRDAGKSGNSNQPAGRGISADVEQPEPTAAQIAALAGGQSVLWERQGMSWTVPPKWVKATEEEKMYVWRSPGSWDAASLIVNISAMDESFPIDSSLNA
ncbi:MAG TPA: hypothetical protein VFH31_11990, partial [Pyrinomonadaceae bacterium]|nr:hypothetical protein [Pyrinomonadaceae bacterium]